MSGGLESPSGPEASHPSSPFSSNTSTRGDFGAIVGSGHSPEAHPPDLAPASQVADGNAGNALRKELHKWPQGPARSAIHGVPNWKQCLPEVTSAILVPSA